MSSLPPAAGERRWDLLWLVAAALLLFLPRLGARDLWNPNEPIYGRAVVEMAASGDWLVPTVNGEPFAEKPPLYYWMALVAAPLLGGVDELVLRLPTAAAGVVGVGLVYLLVYPYAGRRRAWLAALLFATIENVFWSARAVQMDLPLAVATLGAVLAATRVLDHRAPPARGWALCGLAAGCGFLFKGPVGLVCPALVIVAYAAAGRSLARLRLRHVALGALAAGVVAAPWFVALALRGETELLRELLLRQNVARFVEPWDHVKPWWYYLYYFWLDMAPWSLLVPLAAALPDRDDAERRLDRLAWIWIAAIVLFFSLSASKRSAYILPVAPAVAVLASAVLERVGLRALDLARRRILWLLLGAVGLLLLAAGGYVGIAGVAAYPALAAPARAVALLLVAGGVAVLCGLAVRRTLPTAAPAALFAFTVSLYLLAAVWVLPRVDVFKSARPFCAALNAEVGEAELRSYRFWRWRASYVYYAGRTIPRLETPAELRAYWASDGPVYLLVERSRVAEVRSAVGPVEPILDREIGDNAIYLFTNR